MKIFLIVSLIGAFTLCADVQLIVDDEDIQSGLRLFPDKVVRTFAAPRI